MHVRRDVLSGARVVEHGHLVDEAVEVVLRVAGLVCAEEHRGARTAVGEVEAGRMHAGGHVAGVHGDARRLAVVRGGDVVPEAVVEEREGGRDGVPGHELEPEHLGEADHERLGGDEGHVGLGREGGGLEPRLHGHGLAGEEGGGVPEGSLVSVAVEVQAVAGVARDGAVRGRIRDVDGHAGLVGEDLAIVGLEPEVVVGGAVDVNAVDERGVENVAVLVGHVHAEAVDGVAHVHLGIELEQEAGGGEGGDAERHAVTVHVLAAELDDLGQLDHVLHAEGDGLGDGLGHVVDGLDVDENALAVGELAAVVGLVLEDVVRHAVGVGRGHVGHLGHVVQREGRARDVHHRLAADGREVRVQVALQGEGRDHEGHAALGVAAVEVYGHRGVLEDLLHVAEGRGRGHEGGEVRRHTIGVAVLAQLAEVAVVAERRAVKGEGSRRLAVVEVEVGDEARLAARHRGVAEVELGRALLVNRGAPDADLIDHAGVHLVVVGTGAHDGSVLGGVEGGGREGLRRDEDGVHVQREGGAIVGRDGVVPEAVVELGHRCDGVGAAHGGHGRAEAAGGGPPEGVHALAVDEGAAGDVAGALEARLEGERGERRGGGLGLGDRDHVILAIKVDGEASDTRNGGVGVVGLSVHADARGRRGNTLGVGGDVMEIIDHASSLGGGHVGGRGIHHALARPGHGHGQHLGGDRGRPDVVARAEVHGAVRGHRGNRVGHVIALVVVRAELHGHGLVGKGVRLAVLDHGGVVLDQGGHEDVVDTPGALALELGLELDLHRLFKVGEDVLHLVVGHTQQMGGRQEHLRGLERAALAEHRHRDGSRGVGNLAVHHQVKGHGDSGAVGRELAHRQRKRVGRVQATEVDVAHGRLRRDVLGTAVHDVALVRALAKHIAREVGERVRILGGGGVGHGPTIEIVEHALGLAGEGRVEARHAALVENVVEAATDALIIRVLRAQEGAASSAALDLDVLARLLALRKMLGIQEHVTQVGGDARLPALNNSSRSTALSAVAVP
mmetsp:Transcript_23069/g.71906  ORF Transcript_23069/g.71906 Transcript_23069/m.71906 type:complete len:1013 (-) Transcript_23069:104-3142(-)